MEQSDYTLEHNLFSTMTQDEKKKYTGGVMPAQAEQDDQEYPEVGDLPKRVDWRDEAMNPI